MTATTALHSNAFNFMSFLQSGVDPRTGQYTVSLTLPQVAANALLGPSLPLALFFNPLNQQDTGYGKGWNLQLSQFTPDTQVVALHTGESFKVTSRDGAKMLMEEKKLDSFHMDEITNGASTHYLVEHSSGLLEKLQTHAASQPVALPVEVWTRQTRPLKVTYAPFVSDGDTYDRLASIEGSDVEGVYTPLLEIKRDESTRQVQITLNPQGAAATQVRFVMQLDTQGRVIELQLPTVDGNQAKWRFTYTVSHTYNCLAEVRTPTGAWELITYDSVGHKRSNNLSGTLPRVSKHEVRPGNADEAPKAGASCNQIVSYEYTVVTQEDGYQADNNFLGANLALGEPTPGLDILYKHLSAYRYGSVETLLSADGETKLRTIERHFNKFHLLTREITSQGPADDLHIQTVETSYAYEEGKPFKDQPASCQLPLTTTTTWRKAKTDTARTEVLKRDYYEDGNLRFVEHPSGVIETSLWYPAGGEQGACPPDPSDFVRHLKSKTTTPAPSALTPIAPILRQRYRYSALPAYDGNASTSDWPVIEVETLEEVDAQAQVLQELQSTQYTYFKNQQQPLTYGRVEEHTLTMNGLATTTSYTYATRLSTFANDDNKETVLVTTQTVTGHDNSASNIIKKTTTSEHSLLTGELLLNEDEEGVRISYQYDLLRRISTEAVAPGTDHAATRHYHYVLCANDSDRAQQTFITAHGLATVTHLDGLGHPVKELRDHIDEIDLKKSFVIQTIEYDNFGRVTETLKYDFDGAKSLPTLRHRYAYDHWGQQNWVEQPDGVQEHTLNDMVGANAAQTRTVETWRQAPGVALQISSRRKTWFNVFGKPDKIERLNRHGVSAGTQHYEYNGLGQCVKETDEHRNSTRFTYDPWERVTQIQLPDNAKVKRAYAMHSSEDLPTKVQITYAGPAGQPDPLIELGSKTYDGVDRVTQITTGTRTQKLDYDEGKRLPKHRITAAERTLKFDYLPTLTDLPLNTTLMGDAKAEFQSKLTFDKVSANLLSATNQHGVRRFGYDWNNRQKSETWEEKDKAVFNSEKRHSLRGLVLSEAATDFAPTHWHYDDKGRVTRIEQTPLTVEIGYDSLGRPDSFELKNTAKAGPLNKTTIEYDEHDREVLRTLTLDNQAIRTLTQTWGLDDLLRRRELKEGTSLLLGESFGYDTHKRLSTHEYRGSLLPKDALGRNIIKQSFIFDAFDNIICYRNDFDNGEDELTEHIANVSNPTQLESIIHHPARKNPIPPLRYTPDGHLEQDEQGRLLAYDALGHLLQVTNGSTDQPPHSTYRYDALGQLLYTKRGAEGEETRLIFEENRLRFAIRGAHKIQWLHALDMPLAQQGPASSESPLLLHCNANGSIITEATDATRHDASYSSYGALSSDAEQWSSLLGFNGELIDPATGWYLLGSGYRTYNPTLMRFHSPDSLSPFGKGGINDYGYAQGNPIAFRDPTGHFAQGIALTRAYERIAYNAGAQGIALTSVYETESERYYRYRRYEYEAAVKRAEEEMQKAKQGILKKILGVGIASIILSVASLGIGVYFTGLVSVMTLMNVVSTSLTIASTAVSAVGFAKNDEEMMHAADILDYVSLATAALDLSLTLVTAKATKAAMMAQKALKAALPALSIGTRPRSNSRPTQGSSDVHAFRRYIIV